MPEEGRRERRACFSQLPSVFMQSAIAQPERTRCPRSRDMSRPAHELSRKRREGGGTLTLAMGTDEGGAMEQLLTELSRRFTGLPVGQIDEEIERGLRLLVE